MFLNFIANIGKYTNEAIVQLTLIMHNYDFCGIRHNLKNMERSKTRVRNIRFVHYNHIYLTVVIWRY